MKDPKVLEILKSAILLEKRGHSFYSQVASITKNEAAKDFFTHMAEEEVQHIEMLSKQFKAFKEDGHFVKDDFTPNNSIVDAILTEKLKKEIEAASYEASAISSAIDFEKRAIDLYAKRAIEAEDVEEKNLYKWLSSFEKVHLNDLIKLDKELQEKVWNDNNFWPM